MGLLVTGSPSGWTAAPVRSVASCNNATDKGRYEHKHALRPRVLCRYVVSAQPHIDANRRAKVEAHLVADWNPDESARAGDATVSRERVY